MKISKKYLDELTYKINAAIIEVHNHMGPGLLESVYHKCLRHELKLRGIHFKSQLILPIRYKDMEEDIDFRCDLLIEDTIIIELKAVSEITNVHKAQLINYMNLLKIPKGILVNFNVENIMHDGHQTFVNKYFGMLPFD